MMNSETTGAWILHHAGKLKAFADKDLYDQIDTSGKCGLLLSSLVASEDEQDINPVQLRAIGKSLGLSPLEIDATVNKLREKKLVDVSRNGSIKSAGITTRTVLSHTSDIFDELSPSNEERAAIFTAELVTGKPSKGSELLELVSDTFKLSSSRVERVVESSLSFGFIDAENEGKKLNDATLFNGNLFRTENKKKVAAVLESLSNQDESHIRELSQRLEQSGCVPKREAVTVLGLPLYEKVMAIGMFDENLVSNEKGEHCFITHPSAFSKYGPSYIDDALDLAKAFVTSLYYGMTLSGHGRGRIMMLERLLQKLIGGYWVGPATAIGHDYVLLEYKRVIAVKPAGAGMFKMKLLKKDVGELALQVLKFGTASESALFLPGAPVTGYAGPERNRVMIRQQQSPESKREVLNALRSI